MGRMGSEWSTPSRIEGTVSMVAASILAVFAIASADERRSGLGWLGVAALAALGGGIVFMFPAAVGVGTALLGLSGIIAAAPAAPLYAVGLFITAETALWSADDRFRLTEEIGLRRDRLLLLVAVASASIAVGATLRLLARDSGQRNGTYTVIAGLSLVALAGLIAFGARSRRVSA